MEQNLWIAALGLAHDFSRGPKKMKWTNLISIVCPRLQSWAMQRRAVFCDVGGYEIHDLLPSTGICPLFSLRRPWFIRSNEQQANGFVFGWAKGDADGGLD